MGIRKSDNWNTKTSNDIIAEDGREWLEKGAGQDQDNEIYSG